MGDMRESENLKNAMVAGKMQDMRTTGGAERLPGSARIRRL